MKRIFLLAIVLCLVFAGTAMAGELGIYPGYQVFNAGDQTGQGFFCKVRYLHDLTGPWSLGGFAYGFMGSGDMSDGGGYDYHEITFGPSLKHKADGWDAKADIGALFSGSEDENGLYKNSQDVIGGYGYGQLSLYRNRNQGKRFLPETDVSVTLNLPFDTDAEESWDGKVFSEEELYDAQKVSVAVTSFLYDLPFGGDQRISPFVRLGLENQDGDTTYQAGGGLEVQVAEDKKISFAYRHNFDSDYDRDVFQVFASLEF